MNRSSLAVVSALAFAAACCQPTIRAAQARQALTEAQLLARVVRSTVLVETDSGQGSGTIVYADGSRALVLTCYHVVEGAESVMVASPYIGEHKATVEKLDEERDLALLAIDGGKAVALRIAAKNPQPYERIYLIGSPLNAYGSVSQGFIVGSEQGFWFVTGGFVIWGISGGSGVNAAGELECVPRAVRAAHGQAFPQMGICVGLDHIREFLKGYRL